MSYSTTAKLIYGCPIESPKDDDYDQEIPITLNASGKTKLVIVTDGDCGGVNATFIAVEVMIHAKNEDSDPLPLSFADLDVSDDDMISIQDAIWEHYPEAKEPGWYLITDRG